MIIKKYELIHKYFGDEIILNVYTEFHTDVAHLAEVHNLNYNEGQCVIN